MGTAAGHVRGERGAGVFEGAAGLAARIVGGGDGEIGRDADGLRVEGVAICATGDDRHQGGGARWPCGGVGRCECDGVGVGISAGRGDDVDRRASRRRQQTV